MQFEEKEYRMDFEKIILNTLLDKYEASKALYEASNRRIILKMKNLTGYNIENYDRKQYPFVRTIQNHNSPVPPCLSI